MRRGAPRPVPTFIADPDTRPRPVVADTLDDWESVNGVKGSSRVQARASRGLHILLWSLMASAVLFGLLGLLTAGARHGSTGTVATAVPLAADTPPGGCAELLVTAWLAGDTTVLSYLVGADLPHLPVGKRAATRTYTLSTRAVPGSTGQWAYVIGAEVSDVDDQGHRTPAGMQFFATTLTRAATGGACGGWVAPALPAQVAALSTANAQDLVYTHSLATAGAPIADTLTPFFTALLTGSGQVERYLAPGVLLSAVSPAPYSQVRLQHLSSDNADVTAQVPADGTRVRLLATVNVRVAQQAGDWQLSYPLSMTVRGGRWEITSLDPGAVLAPTSTHSPARLGLTSSTRPTVPGSR